MTARIVDAKLATKSSDKPLKNVALVANIGVDTAKNERRKDPEKETILSRRSGHAVYSEYTNFSEYSSE